MATLTCVYDAEPAPRRPHDIIAPPGGRNGSRTLRPRPKARAKWLAGSVEHDPASMIAAAVQGGDGEHPKGVSFADQVAKLPRHDQGTAAVLGSLGEPARVQQRRRPAGQGIGQHPGRPPVPHGVIDRSEMAQRYRLIGREHRGPAQPQMGGAPPVTPRLGPPRQLAQQRVLARQPAALPPPPAQRVRQPPR
jgi:hypothetical protein